MRDEVEVDSGIGRLLSLTRHPAASGKTRLGRPLHVDAASCRVWIRTYSTYFRRGETPRQRKRRVHALWSDRNVASPAGWRTQLGMRSPDRSGTKP